MAIPKRLRYEVLRRDNHACRYCGRAAPDVALTVDHVQPIALGGSDEPSNLVTACTDCNAGKASVAPDAPIVADVSSDALRWAAAMDEAARVQRGNHAEEERLLAVFDDAWTSWVDWREEPFRREPQWESSIGQFTAAGASEEDLLYAVRAAMRSSANASNKWRYFCGVMWKMLRQRQDAAQALLEVEETSDGT